jgi:hypothetical protein
MIYLLKNRCKFKQKCEPYLDYMKINANDQLDLKGFCLFGCDNEINIHTYYLYMLNSTTKQWILFSNSSFYFYTGLYPYKDLTLKEELFKTFSSQAIWKVELNVYLPSKNLSGSASILLFVNFPPKGGSCDVNPKNGTTETFFSISCWNWIDKDGELNSFAYYGRKKLFSYKRPCIG